MKGRFPLNDEGGRRIESAIYNRSILKKQLHEAFVSNEIQRKERDLSISTPKKNNY